MRTLQTNCWQRAFTSCCVAQETLLAGVRPTSHDGVSLGRAMGLWVIAVGVRPTSHNCCPQITKAVSHLLCVDQHRTTV